MKNKKLLRKIFKSLSTGESAIFIGPRESGKTWFVKNELIPFLEKMGVGVYYIKESLDNFKIPESSQVIIADEAETLFDQEFLANLHPKENPYYDEKYIDQVKKSHNLFKKATQPVLFIVTRNEKESLENLKKNLKIMDSGQSIRVFLYGQD